MSARITLESDDRQRRAAAARVRFEELTREMASEQRFGGPGIVSPEVEIMDEAMLVVKQGRGQK